MVAGLVLTLAFGDWGRAQKWERLGPESGMVVSLEAGAGTDVYLGTADGHVFVSTDGANSWELRGRVGNRLDAVITRLVVDPREQKRIFAAVWYQETGAGGGIFQSQDGGQTWKLLGLEGETVRALEIAPSQPEELVAGTRSGVFHSTDSGKSWGRISPEGDEELRNVDSIAIDPRDPKIIYAGTYHLPWLTRDGGKIWKPVIAGIIDDSDIMSLRLDVSDPDRLYMSACSGIYRSENQGGNWTKLQGIPYAARRTQVIVQDPGNPSTWYAGTTEGLWVTRDGGESWGRTTSKDWVVNSLVVLGNRSGSPGRVVLGTDGQGIQVSDDAGARFAEANQGFTHVVVKQIVRDPSDSTHLLMVLERATPEILESRDGGKSWTLVSLAAEERGKATTGKADLVEEIRASPWGWMVRREDGQLWIWDENRKLWKEWKLVLSASKPRTATRGTRSEAQSPSTPPLAPGTAIAFSNKDAAVSTNAGLLRCQESGNCSRLKAFGPGAKVRAVWLSTTGQELAAVRDGKLGFSSDGGETAVWRDLPVPDEREFLLDVVERGPKKILYLGTSRGIYLSHSAGAEWQTVTGGLPAGRVEQWLLQTDVLAASERDGGLYISRDGGAFWERVDQDPERSRLTGLVAMPDGAILAGSQSEGLLRLELTEKSEAAGKR
jgi:photosystem II stability/assembly factor-like uncharacterized protein